jgi:prepilin-type N-terminal cleavage/methylation domain-containing protein
MRASQPASFLPRGGNGAGPGQGARGVSLLEMLMTLALVLILSAIALPLTDRMRQEGKVRGAAYAIATRSGWLRIASVHRGARVGMRFTQAGGSWITQSFVDGDWDGVLSADIASGRDPAIDQPLDVRQWGVEFGFAPGCPLVDGSAIPAGASPVRLGASRTLVFTPDGASSGGSLYVRGPTGTAAYAVVILAATGRSRLLRCAAGSSVWVHQ